MVAVVCFVNDTATTEIYTYLHTLSLHDALPIWAHSSGDAPSRIFEPSETFRSRNMAEITAAAVKELRDRSGAGMMDCKKALTEANGDIEAATDRSEEHTSELQSLMRISYAVFCLKKNRTETNTTMTTNTQLT